MAETLRRQVNIFVDSGQADAAYKRLSQNEIKYRQEIEKRKKSNSDTAELEAKLAKTIEQKQRVEKKMTGELSLSYKDLTSAVRKLRMEHSLMSEQDPGFDNITRQLQHAEDQLTKYRTGIKSTAEGWRNMLGQVKGVAVGVLVGNTLQAAVESIGSYVTGAIRNLSTLSDEISNIQKTTGLGQQSVEFLNKELGKMDTRTSRSELRQLAAEAGKLGKSSVEDIKKFVSQADKIKVALGEDLGDDAILKIGKLADVFDTEMLNIGSAVNALGAASSASEQYLVDFGARLGGTAVTANIAAPDILGYGAVLDSLGIQAEMSGTALSNFFIDFVKDTSKFEKAAGMAAGSLQKLIGEKGTNAGFVAFLENLKAANPESASFLKKLEQIGVDGSRGASVFLALSNNIDAVKTQQALANDEFSKATSITNEFNIKNQNLAANIEKIKKAFAGFFTSSSLTNVLSFFIAKLADTRTAAEKLTESYLKQAATTKQLENDVRPLITRYDDLKSKSELNKEEQEELNAIIQKIAALLPQAVTEWDKYGNAIEISTQKTKDALATNEQLLKAKFRDVIKDINEEVKRLQFNVVSAQNTLNQGFTTRINPATDREIKIPLSAETIQKLRDEILVANEQIVLSYEKLRDEFKVELTPDQIGFISGFKKSLGIVEEVKQEVKKTVEENLETLKDDTEFVKAYQKEKERLEAFKSEIKKLNEELTMSSMSEDEKQLYSIRKKYDEMYAKAKTTYPALFGLMQEYYEQIKQLQAQETFNATSSIEYQAALNATAKYFEDEKLLRKKQYADGLIDRETYQQMLTFIDVSHKAAKVKVAEDYSKTVQQAQKDFETFSADSYQADLDLYIANKEARAEIDAQEAEAREKAAQEEIDRQKKIADARKQIAINVAGEMLNLASEFVALADRQDQEELSLFKKKQDDKKNSLKKRLDAGKLSQAQYNASIEKLDAETAKKEKDLKIESFKRNKALRVADSIQTTALASIQAYQSMLAIPVAGPALGAVAAAAVAAFGAIRTMMILTENPPEFEQGGIEGQGISKGDRHAQGGIDLIERRTGKRRGNMEGGELILSRGFVATNPDLIDPLLEASKRKQRLADVHPAFRARALSINASRAAENAMFESGGLFDAVRAGTNTARNGNSGAAADVAINMVIVEELLRSIDNRLAALEEKELIDYSELARTMRYINDVLEKQI